LNTERVLLFHLSRLTRYRYKNGALSTEDMKEIAMKDKKDSPRSQQKPTAEAESACPFCPPNVAENIIEQHGSAFVIRDKNPVSQGHLLILPVRHTPDFFSMTAEERRDAEELIMLMRNRTYESDSSVLGFNIGTNCGEVAGQTIFHAHIHLIPRRAGDVKNPRGGVRGVIPAKMHY
jgi:diadenosine tetraphosphate (Ap4A) HIT family hydrolase